MTNTPICNHLQNKTITKLQVKSTVQILANVIYVAFIQCLLILNQLHLLLLLLPCVQHSDIVLTNNKQLEKNWKNTKTHWRTQMWVANLQQMTQQGITLTLKTVPTMFLGAGQGRTRSQELWPRHPSSITSFI